MTYFDTAYIAKCYLHEPGAERVRAFAAAADGLASCELARLELASLLRRHRREGKLTPEGWRLASDGLQEDERSGVWQWLPVTSTLIESARRRFNRLPGDVVLRAGDALHLTCAEQNGFEQIYSNDRHLLAAAPHFHLEGINLLEG